MRRGASAIATIAAAAFVLLLLAWAMRFRIAGHLVDRTLAAAQVPASYRLTKIGPLNERLENVRIGDPKAPDLVARRIDVALGYGWAGPTVRAIAVDGVRVQARLDGNGLSLGAIDRLMAKSTGGRARLPDLTVRLRDVTLALTTPNGAIQAAIEGAGNPQTNFRGRTTITAPALRLASCTLRTVSARLALRASAGRPEAAGPLRIVQSDCPQIALGDGQAAITLSSDADLRTLSLEAMLDGFGGRAAGGQFAAVHGPVLASGRIGALQATGDLTINALALPDLARSVASLARLPAGTPIGPTGARAAQAFARILTRSDARVDVVAALHGTETDVRVRHLALTDSNGGRITADARGGIGWTRAGWQADADIASGGGDLPAIRMRIRQPAPGAALTGTASLADYTAGEARLGAGPLRFGWDGRRGTFDTLLRIDGPVGSGFVHGLRFPVRGAIDASGALAVDSGCQAVGFRALRLSGFRFDGALLSLCGQPIVARANGVLRIEAKSGPLHLTGRTSGGAPVALNAATLTLNQNGFRATDVEAAIGPADRRTRFAVAGLEGAFDAGGASGRFSGGSGAIANVPLTFAEADGAWRFAGGRLHLGGGLRVADAAATPRFNPLATDDALLDLADGVIRATATLRAPTSKAAVTKVAITHALSSGDGHALLTVDGIRFAPKGLQPESLTPLTLGVIANVAGSVGGSGRIDWSAKGVTSSGSFATEGLDLAAAFGPVTGVKGRIVFTDLLGLVSAPDQEATIAEINPGVQVANGIVHYQLVGGNRIRIADATWPFAGGTLRMDSTLLDFDAEAERHLTFRIEALDAAAFVQQLDFPNIAATGRFDGVLPMIFDHRGGRIEAGHIVARPGGGTLAYVGELTNAELGTMGKLAFDALKAIRYSALTIDLDGSLDGEMISRVRFSGVREATAEQGLAARLIRNLPFRFNIEVRAPFRALVGSARAYIDPRLLLTPAQLHPNGPPTAPSSIQPKESEIVR